MATNAPFGFRPLRHLSGGDPNRTRQYPIASGYATALGTGDPVKALTDGSIALAAAGERILGIFQGVQYTAADGSAVFTNYWTASTSATNVKASVVTDPNVTFEVQSAGTPVIADTFLLADHITGTASSVTGTSAATLSGTMATGNAGFRILALVDKPGNSGLNATLEVQIFEHEYNRDDAATPGV